MVIKGEVENKFIFATLTGKCVLPFKVNFLPIVLPITKGELSFQISKVRDLRNNGDFKMAEWLDAVEVEWKKNATKTSLKSYPNPVDYVNYHNKLTRNDKIVDIILFTLHLEQTLRPLLSTQKTSLLSKWMVLKSHLMGL